MTDLHARLKVELDRRLAVANAAAVGWDSAVRIQLNHALGDAELADAIVAYLDVHDPADAIRRYTGELEVLERHSPATDQPDQCRWCYSDAHDDYQLWPCPEIRSLASRLGMPLTAPGTPG